MKRLAFILSLTLADPALANQRELLLERCVKFADMVETIAAARGEHHGLIGAMRKIPDMPEVGAFGYERMFVQELLRHMEPAHGVLTPMQLGVRAEDHCVQTINEKAS